MYYDFQVEIPEAKGKIITKKKGSVTYVLYQYGQEYKSEKRYAIPKRAIIGKVSSENSSMMFPNSEIWLPDFCFSIAVTRASTSSYTAMNTERGYPKQSNAPA